jgi:thiol:disulfide interchange protein
LALAVRRNWGIFWGHVTLKRRTTLPLLVLAALAAFQAGGLRAEPEYPAKGPDIYDVRADGGTQIAAALTRAAAEHKRVLVDFGANWCIWCRRLHATFESDASVSRALGRGFVVVMIDVNTRNGTDRNAAIDARYGNPTRHGLPVLVVLDSDGKQLTTKDSGELEEGDGHSPAKITAFLAAWAPPGNP